MKLLRGQKLCSRYKSNRVFLDLSSNKRWDNFYEKKSQHAGFNIIYNNNINKLMGREGEVRVLMNTLNSSSYLKVEPYILNIKFKEPFFTPLYKPVNSLL